MKTRIYKAILTVLLILAMAGSAMCTATYDPISDNGMKAYVWCSDAETRWHYYADEVESELASQGFEVIRHTKPSVSLIHQTISDPNVKIYWGLGHGSDTHTTTGNGVYDAISLGTSIKGRGTPFTIGIFQHCGEYLCYTPGCWLNESTQGDGNVVAQRFYGSGWCGDEAPADDGLCVECLNALGGEVSTSGYGAESLFYRLEAGYTYEHAVDTVSWRYAEGRKQGNRDLRYPQFCGDVNYDMVVNQDDATLLQNYLANPTTNPIHSEWDADVNGDGSINVNDANLLSDHIADPSAHPLNPRGWCIGGYGCPCDLNGDGFVNGGDVLEIVLNWGPCDGCPEDLNGDGYVNNDDITVIVLNWGPCP